MQAVKVMLQRQGWKCVSMWVPENSSFVSSLSLESGEKKRKRILFKFELIFFFFLHSHLTYFYFTFTTIY